MSIARTAHTFALVLSLSAPALAQSPAKPGAEDTAAIQALVASYARSGGQDRFRAKTGLPLATYFSGLKLKWLLDNVPGARAKAEAGDAERGHREAHNPRPGGLVQPVRTKLIADGGHEGPGRRHGIGRPGDLEHADAKRDE